MLLILYKHRRILSYLIEKILSVIGRHFVIMQSLYSKDTRVTKYRTITRASLQDDSNSLPIIGDRYSTKGHEIPLRH